MHNKCASQNFATYKQNSEMIFIRSKSPHIVEEVIPTNPTNIYVNLKIYKDHAFRYVPEIQRIFRPGYYYRKFINRCANYKD